ncbi:MAG TPA: S8 family serine peptidase [Methylibium sp.]|nr:S8 family serine peptidase [Methylibium sp.]
MPVLNKLLAGLALALPLVLAAAPRAERPAQGLIVRMAADAGEADWQSLQQAAGLQGRAMRERGPRSRVIGADRVLRGAEARELARRLRSQPGVAWVEPNTRERRLQAVVPDDPDFTAGLQWWLRPATGSNGNAIEDRLRGVGGFQTGWITTTGSADSVIAVLDTGITTHPELTDRVIVGRDFVSEVEYANDGDGRDADASDPGDWVSAADQSGNAALFGDCELEDSSWHGSVIAGQLVAATDNATRVAAMQWAGRVLAVRVAGKCGATVADIVDGMRWAAGLPVTGAPINPNPARVVTVSFGGSASCSAAYQEAIDDLRAAGAVVVAAAGNEHGGVLRPANCDGVIGVGAVNRDGFKTTYSNFGPELVITTVGGDPGGDGRWGSLLGDSGLLTLNNDGTTAPGAAAYAYVFGSSFSTPQVAGALGLMLAARPSLSAAQLIDGLRLSARPHVTSPVIGACSSANPGRCICSASTCGAGLLDVPEALRYASDPSSYSAPARTGAVIDNAEVRSAAALGADRPANSGSDDDDEDSGISGGALGWPWLAALWLAVGAVWALRRRRRA